MKSVAYTCPFVPAEWIAAHRLRPHRIIPRAASTSAAVVPTGMCPYVLAFHESACRSEPAEAVIVTTACDQMRRAAELIERDCDRPVFLMNVPSVWQTASALKLYVDELKRLGAFLVRLGGAAPSTEFLIEVMLKYDAARSAVRAARGLISPRRHAELIVESCRGVDPAIDLDSPAAAGPATGVPLALVGGPLRREDLVIFDLVEAAGGTVVLDGTDAGERTMPAAFSRRRLRGDPLAELADAYFGSIPAAFRRPNSGLYQWLKAELARRDVRGIVFVHYLWCDIWQAELGRLKEWAGTPVLDLDISGQDDSATRVKGRIESFLEMLQ